MRRLKDLFSRGSLQAAQTRKGIWDAPPGGGSRPPDPHGAAGCAVFRENFEIFKTFNFAPKPRFSSRKRRFSRFSSVFEHFWKFRKLSKFSKFFQKFHIFGSPPRPVRRPTRPRFRPFSRTKPAGSRRTDFSQVRATTHSRAVTLAHRLRP